MGISKLDLIKLYAEKREKEGDNHKIRLELKQKNKVYCYIEGEDEGLYFPVIQNYTKNEIVFINAKGRRNVIEKHRTIKNMEKYSNYSILYFVDKDFNTDEIPKAIYQTPCYSIENLYVHKDVVSSILEYAWRLDKEDKETAIFLYENAQKEYHQHALELNAFIKLQIHLEEEKKEKISLNLNNINFNNIYDINLAGTNKNKELNEIKNQFVKILKYEESQLQEMMNTFTPEKYWCEFRGKHELLFLDKFLNKLKNELGKRKNQEYFSKRYNIKSPISDIMGTYSQYAKIPKCMNLYLHERLAE